jgi:hypothetical protein
MSGDYIYPPLRSNRWRKQAITLIDTDKGPERLSGIGSTISFPSTLLAQRCFENCFRKLSCASDVRLSKVSLVWS